MRCGQDIVHEPVNREGFNRNDGFGHHSSNLCIMELNSRIFYDDRRKGAKDVGGMLELRQLGANTSKSKFVLMAPPKSRTVQLKRRRG